MSGPASFSREIALGWSVEAMNAAADRVNKIPAAETGLAFAAFGEAVWWITVVNDALAKRYPEAYAAARGFRPHGSKRPSLGCAPSDTGSPTRWI